jgi:hypothetical protein
MSTPLLAGVERYVERVANHFERIRLQRVAIGPREVERPREVVDVRCTLFRRYIETRKIVRAIALCHSCVVLGHGGSEAP